MKKVILMLLFIGLMPFIAYPQGYAYKNRTLSPEARAKDLIGRMTLDEKIMQLQCMWRDKTEFFTNGEFDEAKARKALKNGIGQLARLNEDLHPAVAHEYHPTLPPRQAAELYNKVQKFFMEETRLGIPVISHEEGLHGQQAADATNFPVPIGLASSWNEHLIGDIYTCVAKEIRSKGGSVALAPVIDVVRDPRWGRTEECMGEDPYLVSRLGVAAVKAFQGDGDNIDKNHVAATLKHFGVHGQSEGGNNTAPGFMDEYQTREVYLKSFQTCIKEAAPVNIMVTYNELWGTPAHANRKLLHDILRRDFGFKGIVVSDYQGISNLVNTDKVTPSLDEAGYLAFKAGVDIELPTGEGFKNLGEYVKNGKLSIEEIDAAATRILIEKFRLGLFDDPYVDPDRAEQIVGCDAHRKVAYRAAAESMVLLKNENNFLPLDKNNIKTIALIGPNADRCILGGYSSVPKTSVSPLQAIKEKYGDRMNILYSEGVRLTDVNSPFPPVIRLVSMEDNYKRMAEAVEAARKADVVVLFVGGNEAISREAYSVMAPGDLPTLELLNGQQELIRRIVALDKPTCAFVNSGTTLSIGELADAVPAVMQCWYLGQEGGYAMIDALFSDINPSGKLPVSFPRSAGHIPAYYSHKPSSRRGYNLGLDVSPLYPFGYGLSYTSFEYGNLKLNDARIKKDGTTVVSVDIKNTGKREGAEIVEMYIRDDYSSVTRPVKELKGFRKINLKPGEMQTVTFTVSAESLAFYNADMEWVVEPGDFTIMAGPSSDKVEEVKLHVE
ncbi:MAG: glycoside hydrolase family 3 C-terminal domain-containing protein [Tannerellaceae bacterium]|jgi:beta-glucosidase|nr:glycoside hydrolase family 3 C-terminal domain-containing protein [Tannerellaceae bacterium]